MNLREWWSMRAWLRLFSTLTATVTVVDFPQAGFSNLFRALLCELFQIQRAPASTATELCFHHAGFLGSFKLIFIPFSLLRPLKRAAFLPSLVNQGPSCSLGQRSAWWGVHGHTSLGLPYTRLGASRPLFTWALGKPALFTPAGPAPTWIWWKLSILFLNSPHNMHYFIVCFYPLLKVGGNHENNDFTEL